MGCVYIHLYVSVSMCTHGMCIYTSVCKCVCVHMGCVYIHLYVSVSRCTHGYRVLYKYG